MIPGQTEFCPQLDHPGPCWLSYILDDSGGHSSAGRASASQAGCRGFEPRCPLQTSLPLARDLRLRRTGSRLAQRGSTARLVSGAALPSRGARLLLRYFGRLRAPRTGLKSEQAPSKQKRRAWGQSPGLNDRVYVPKRPSEGPGRANAGYNWLLREQTSQSIPTSEAWKTKKACFGTAGYSSP
jgi:hypothetical protein